MAGRSARGLHRLRASTRGAKPVFREPREEVDHDECSWIRLGVAAAWSVGAPADRGARRGSGVSWPGAGWRVVRPGVPVSPPVGWRPTSSSGSGRGVWFVRRRLPAVRAPSRPVLSRPVLRRALAPPCPRAAPTLAGPLASGGVVVRHRSRAPRGLRLGVRLGPPRALRVDGRDGVWLRGSWWVAGRGRVADGGVHLPDRGLRRSAGGMRLSDGGLRLSAGGLHLSERRSRVIFGVDRRRGVVAGACPVMSHGPASQVTDRP